jgi:hypothetical protein
MKRGMKFVIGFGLLVLLIRFALSAIARGIANLIWFFFD